MAKTKNKTNCDLSPRLLPLQEFLETGYLQEVNRQFFHPLGLSLAYIDEKDPRLVVCDFRYVQHGPMFSPEVLNSPKFLERTERVALECAEKLLERQMNLGFGIQVARTATKSTKRNSRQSIR